MSMAPRDGTPVRLHLRDGSDFVGLYSDRWRGWIAFLNHVRHALRETLVAGADGNACGYDDGHQTEPPRSRRRSDGIRRRQAGPS
jgi:hypothetical protein